MLEKLNLGEAFKDREEGNSSEKQGKIIPSEKSYPDIKPKNNCVGKRERRDKEERKDMLFCAVLSHSVVSDSLRPPDCSPLGSSVHGIQQARKLEWVAYHFSRGTSQPRNQTGVSCIADRFFTS